MKKTRSIFISIIFLIVSFFSSSVIYSIEIQSELESEKNSFMSSDSICFSVTDKSSTVINDESYNKYKNMLLNIESKQVILTSDNTFSAYGIYFNKKLENVPPMLSGRFFKISDFNRNNKYVVIGKDLKDDIVKINDTKYYYINNNQYEVIGIMGDSKRETPYDYSVYYNLDGYFSFPDNGVELKYMIDSSNKNEGKIIENILNADFNVTRIESELANKKDYFIEDLKCSMKLIIGIIITLILSTALVTEYWIKNRKKEIGIKRALGATKLKISFEIIGELIRTSSISYIVGYILYLIFYLIKDGYVNFYFSLIVIVFLITLLSSLLVSFIPIKESLKVQPREIMR